MTAQQPGTVRLRRTIALFVAVAVVSVTALVWMGVRLLTQERALEAQRLQERREAAADRVVAALEQVLMAEERRLTNPLARDPIAGDSVVVIGAGPGGIRVSPEDALLFYPVMPAARDAPAESYSCADRLEFVERDYAGAISVLRVLVGSRDPAVRAGAQLRLARNLRRVGRPNEALEVFAALTRGTGAVSGLPADLVGRSARCLLFGELGRRDELSLEARGLLDGLASGRWRLDRDSYLH